MPSVREWMGDPISDNARVVEHYSLSEDGILTGVLTLHDPDNYKVPMVRRAHWRRSDDSGIKFPTLCDPDSFIARSTMRAKWTSTSSADTDRY